MVVTGRFVSSRVEPCSWRLPGVRPRDGVIHPCAEWRVESVDVSVSERGARRGNRERRGWTRTVDASIRASEETHTHTWGIAARWLIIWYRSMILPPRSFDSRGKELCDRRTCTKLRTTNSPRDSSSNPHSAATAPTLSGNLLCIQYSCITRETLRNRSLECLVWQLTIVYYFSSGTHNTLPQ